MTSVRVENTSRGSAGTWSLFSQDLYFKDLTTLENAQVEISHHKPQEPSQVQVETKEKFLNGAGNGNTDIKQSGHIIFENYRSREISKVFHCHSAEIQCADNVPVPIEDCFLVVEGPEFYNDTQEMRRGNCKLDLENGRVSIEMQSGPKNTTLNRLR